MGKTSFKHFISNIKILISPLFAPLSETTQGTGDRQKAR